MKKESKRAIRHLKDAVKRLAERAESTNAIGARSLGDEISLLVPALETVAQLVPMLKTSELKHPVGDEVPLVEPPAGSQSELERIVDESDLMPAWFLERGAQIQRSVARVVLTKPHAVSSGTFPPGTGWATGFMVSPSLFMTNNHVIGDRDFAKKVRMQFNFQLSPEGLDRPTESFLPMHGDVFHTHVGLDYTLIRMRPSQPSQANTQTVLPGDKWGFVELNEMPTFRPNQHFNIVQHPGGRRKEIALQDNEIDKLFTTVVRYKSDTEPGSSGSPVFDNLWQLVAVHHAGGDFVGGKFINNEGIRIDAIIKDLKEHFAGQQGGQAVLNELGIG